MRRAVAATILCVLAAVPAKAQAPVQIVFFPDWSGAMDDAAKAVIEHAADAAKQAPKATITVTGYADAKGSAKANQFLAKLRAQRVIDALVDDGVPAAHLKMVAAGKQPETGVVGRRVEIAIGK